MFVELWEIATQFILKKLNRIEILPINYFSQKLFRFSKKLTSVQAMMRELMANKQESDESVAEYIAKIQNLADRAFHGQTEEPKQQVSLNAYCNGLNDQDAARLVALQAKGSVARVMNIAACVGPYSKHPMKARKYKPDKIHYPYNFLSNESTAST